MQSATARLVCVIAMVLVVLQMPPYTALALGILVPQRPAMAGVTGRYFADAQTAMAAGVDAQWYNPAGLPLGPRRAVSAGAVPIMREQLTASGQAEEQLRAGAGFVAMAWGPDPRGDYPRLGVGWHLSWPDAEDMSASASTGGVIDAGAVPSDLRGGTDISSAFPEGIRREERSTGRGALQTLSIGAQVGLAARRCALVASLALRGCSEDAGYGGIYQDFAGWALPKRAPIALRPCRAEMADIGG